MRRFQHHHLKGQRVRVLFMPNWPVPVGNYTYNGWDEVGVWVTHDESGQRRINYSDIDDIEAAT